MNASKIFSALFLATFFMLTSCQKEENLILDSPLSEEQGVLTDSEVTTRSSGEKTLIVLSAPSVNNNYYYGNFSQTIDFLAGYANKIQGKDEVVILADAATLPYFQGKVSSDILIQANIEDIWLRDFGTVMPGKQAKFNYLPYYQQGWVSNLVDNSFENWYQGIGGTYYKKSNLILDGGNVVDNAAGDRVIVTDRFLFDNPQLTKKQAKSKLKRLLGVQEVAIIKEMPGDATGHADGMVMWATDNKILLHQLPSNVRTKVKRELKRSFPGVQIVTVPDYYENDTWQGFTSACNIFVNATVTDDYIYMPTFNDPHDSQMLSLFRQHTNKTVVPIPASGVCFMGGSVRCLSMQVKGPNKQVILNQAGN